MVYQKLLLKSLCLYTMIEIFNYRMNVSGSVVERLLSKWEVMGLTPLSGSILFKLVIINK